MSETDRGRNEMGGCLDFVKKYGFLQSFHSKTGMGIVKNDRFLNNFLFFSLKFRGKCLSLHTVSENYLFRDILH